MSTSDFIYLDKTISGKIRYYSHLSLQGKERFCNRVTNIMQQKEFEGMEDFEVNDEVKILISAAAVQLTFGLHDYSLEAHDLIRIFPTTFYNTRTGDEYKGLTLKQGLIALSWEDFENGYLIDDDNFNLGLHELAHALRLSVNTDDFDSRFANHLDDWDAFSSKELEHIQQYPDESFLRNYAATNLSEFFSVCVEYFFEVPQKFKERLPDIYNHLCDLLNQDPLNIQNDYRLQIIGSDVEPYQIPESVTEPYYRFKEWSEHVDTFIVIGFFTGLLCFWFYIDRMKINFGTFCMICTYSFFSLMVLTQLFKTIFTLRRINSIDIMRMVLISPFISLLIFSINYVTPLSKTNERYTISYVQVRTLTRVTDEVVVFYPNDELAEYPKLRTFKTEGNSYGWNKVSYQFEKGIFGFQNLKSRTIINKDKTQIPY